jgi:hypothetical protein
LSDNFDFMILLSWRLTIDIGISSIVVERANGKGTLMMVADIMTYNKLNLTDKETFFLVLKFIRYRQEQAKKAGYKPESMANFQFTARDIAFTASYRDFGYGHFDGHDIRPYLNKLVRMGLLEKTQEMGQTWLGRYRGTAVYRVNYYKLTDKAIKYVESLRK